MKAFSLMMVRQRNFSYENYKADRDIYYTHTAVSSTYKIGIIERKRKHEHPDFRKSGKSG